MHLTVCETRGYATSENYVLMHSNGTINPRTAVGEGEEGCKHHLLCCYMIVCDLCDFRNKASSSVVQFQCVN